MASLHLRDCSVNIIKCFAFRRLFIIMYDVLLHYICVMFCFTNRCCKAVGHNTQRCYHIGLLWLATEINASWAANFQGGYRFGYGSYEGLVLARRRGLARGKKGRALRRGECQETALGKEWWLLLVQVL